MTVKAVLFDLDGVLCDTAGLHYIAWKDLAKKLGGDIDEEFNHTLKGLDRVESLRRVCRHINYELTNEEIDKYCTIKNDYYVTLLGKLTKADILPGIEEFVISLKNEGIKIVVASASKNAPLILESIKLIEYIDYIVNPASVANGKPAPDIFLAGAEHFGFGVDECVGIEDAQAGVDALISANIKSIGIGTYLEGANIILESTSELNIDLFKKL